MAHSTGSVHKETAFISENQGVRDTQNRVNRVRIGRLADIAAASYCIPFRAKVSAFKAPDGTAPENMGVLVGRFFRGRFEVNRELIGRLRRRIQKAA